MKEREALLNAPEREDERLTRPSVPSEILKLLEKQPSRSLKSDPERLREARENYEAAASDQEAHRREALEILYSNAREFIVNEKQLDAAIEEVFGSDEAPISWGIASEQSIWGLLRADNATTMLRQQSSNPSFTTRPNADSYPPTSHERIQHITETLTRGKN